MVTIISLNVMVGSIVVQAARFLKHRREKKFDDFELIDGDEKGSEVELHEEPVQRRHVFNNVDFGLGFGTIEINIHD